MNPVLRNTLAVIAGALVGSVVNGFIIGISGKIIPPPAGADLTTMEGLKASMHLFTPINFLMPWLAHALGTFVGAILAALIAVGNKMRAAMIVSVLFLIGLAVSLLRTRLREYLLLNGYFWGATLSVGLFAIPPSADSYRMLMAFPAALIMCAIGLDQVLEIFGIGWANAKKMYIASVSFVLLSLLILNMWTYFGDFAGQCRFGGNLAGRFASYLGSYVKTLESESSVYLLSDGQFFYGSHASTDFLSQLRPIINHPDPLDSLHAIHGETIIANPDRIKELEDWVRLHPGGKVHYVYDCQNTILMAYQVP